MRKIFFYISILFSVICYSQNNTGLPNATGNKSFLPNVTPPSPESFSITEYGKNSLTENTGKLSINIPIYKYSAGQLNLPITLNYNGAGVKVNDMASWTGINWTLTAGGVINRQINDSPDEAIYTSRQNFSEIDLINDASNTCSPNSQYYYYLCYHKDLYDTEVDVFNYSFNGYSGSFFFDSNFNVVDVQNENELKIELIGSEATNMLKLRYSKTFMITTPDGIKYYFGGLETERTMMYSGHRGNSFESNSSFYLYKIEHPVNGTVTLEYITEAPRLLNLSASYSMERPLNISGDPGNFSNLKITSSRNQVFNPKRLSKIKSNESNIEVVFNSTAYGNHHFISTLNNIEVKNDTVLIKNVEFYYISKNDSLQTFNDLNSSTRFFLEKVKINNELDNTGNKHEEYKFEYDSLEDLPDRLSKSQDLLGYFNGAYNQYSLIPYNTLFNSNYSNNFANRHPVFELAKKGSLIKVTYPTKGYSVFEYEPSKAREKKYKTYQRSIVGNEIAQIPSYSELIDDIEYFTPIYDNQDVSIKIKTGFSSEIDPMDGLMYYQAYHNLRVELTITDLTSNAPNITTVSRPLAMNPVETSYTYPFLKNHTYSIQIKFLTLPNISYPFINNIYASFTMEVFDGYNIIDGFGVRLKRQTDFSKNLMKSNEKRYYYGRINDHLIENATYPEISYKPNYSVEFVTNSNNPLGVILYVFSETSGKYMNDSNNEFYDIVSTSFGGDNFENGGTEKYYYYTEDYAIERIKIINDGCWVNLIGEVDCGLPTGMSTNTTGLISGWGIPLVRDAAKSNEKTKCDAFNGKLIGERYFIKKNDELFKTKEIIYNYSFLDNLSKQATNFVGRTLFGFETVGVYCTPDLTGPELKPLGSCYIGYYSTKVYDSYLNSIITKEYIDPIPMSSYIPLVESILNFFIDYNYQGIEQIEQPFKKIVTTQEFTYGTLRGLPLETKTYSSDGSMLLTKNYYPNQANNLSLSSSDEVIANNKLVSQNRIATPIQVEQYRNGDLLSTQRTVNKSWNNNPELILPEKILTSKGTQPLEERAIFSEYDANGNLSVLSLKDGSKTKYFYNNLNQVILKVENYSASLNIPAIPTWSYPCDFIAQYPSALISIYNYDPTTNQIVSIINPNCKKTEYVYDALHRLKYIIDSDGNIVQEYDQNYKPQN